MNAKEKAIRDLEKLIDRWRTQPARQYEITCWLEYVFRNLSQPRIVKPGPIITNHFPGCEKHYYLEEERFKTFRGLGIGPLHRTARQEGKKIFYLGLHFPVVPKRNEIVHDSVFAELHGEGPRAFYKDFDIPKHLVENGVFGYPSANKLTYLKYKGVTSLDKLGPLTQKEWSKDPLERILRIVVDSKRLMERRDIYFDPEAVADVNTDEDLRAGKIGPEYRRTFCVFGGIPFEAIKRVEFV